MKKLLGSLSYLLVLVFFVLFSAQAVVGTENMSIVGVVNSDAQILTDDGELYNIGATEKSGEVEMLEGKRVEVTGEVVEVDGENYIEIEEYIVVEKP